MKNSMYFVFHLMLSLAVSVHLAYLPLKQCNFLMLMLFYYFQVCMLRLWKVVRRVTYRNGIGSYEKFISSCFHFAQFPHILHTFSPLQKKFGNKSIHPLAKTFNKSVIFTHNTLAVWPIDRSWITTIWQLTTSLPMITITYLCIGCDGLQELIEIL